ncbi:TetR/AcrR family transcriptional regulator [Phycicoccus avicenniae]|uniref:TetR/AcrR family transcriptional regulator n=1 Tax=Phycicoccus avicenniae TaxID=2828860 RepID=UPI003D297EB4
MSSSRTYRSELREQQAQHTRAAIAREARARFVAAGWAGTTVRSVAEAAGVSEATVYNVYGSKAGLAVSLVDAAEEGADVRRAAAELVEREGDPRGQLATFVGFDRRLFERGGDVLRVLGEARRQHPELGEAYDEGRRRGGEQRRRVLSTWPASVWRTGVDVERALTVYAMVVSLDSYDVAVREGGWSADEVEDWWLACLEDLLLRPAGRGRSGSGARTR